MKPEKPKYLYTVFATYPDYLERIKQGKPLCVFTQIVSTNAREANTKAREYASTGIYSSVEVRSTKNNRVTKIL